MDKRGNQDFLAILAEESFLLAHFYFKKYVNIPHLPIDMFIIKN